jgi:hypothetical protein
LSALLECSATCRREHRREYIRQHAAASYRRKLDAAPMEERPAARRALQELVEMAAAAAAAERAKAAARAAALTETAVCRVCRVCACEFAPRHGLQAFCSTICRRVQQRKYERQSRTARKPRAEAMVMAAPTIEGGAP